MSHAVKKFQRYCQSHPEITDLDEIFDAVITDAVKEHYHTLNEAAMLLDILFFDDGKIKQIYYWNDGKGYQTDEIGDYFVLGVHQEEIEAYINDNRLVGDVLNVFNTLFHAFNSYPDMGG